MRHAFLIIAHNEFLILQNLIKVLDDERIDVYLHIDKKVKEQPELHTHKAGLRILKERIDTRWGHYSQIQTEMALFKAAMKGGHYAFYHLISGTHLPLKPICEILNFYDGYQGKSIFHRLNEGDSYQNKLKIRHYNLFLRNYAFGSQSQKRISQILWRLNNAIQDRLGVACNCGLQLFHAANWVSLSQQALEFIIGNETLVEKYFRYSFCGDEYFVPTILMNSELKKDVKTFDSILYQDMGSANARVLTMDDYDAMMHSGCLWGRKFATEQLNVVEKVLVTIG